MKTVVAKVTGTPAPGDLVVLSYSTPRGGRSDAKHIVRGAVPQLNGEEVTYSQPDTLASIAQALAYQINNEKGEWCPGTGDFKATAKGETIYIQCSDLVSNVKLSAEVCPGSIIEGAFVGDAGRAPTMQVELREFGGAQ